ncbi:MAG: mandelate racemase/muconate lactonizing enzyme family protein [Pseudomonadota bacterium]
MRISLAEILHCDAGWRDFSFLRLHTDEGVTGIAEYNECYGSFGLSAVIERLATGIYGMDAMRHEHISQLLYAQTRQAPGGINAQAIAAIENALLDIKGKALGLPVHALLGGAIRDRLELYWSHCGTYRLDPANAERMQTTAVRNLDDVEKLGAEVAAKGYKGLKTNIFLFGDGDPKLHMPGFGRAAGVPELNASPAVIAALREQMQAFRSGGGERMNLHLDLNFNFKPEGYTRVMRALDDLGLTWFELDIYDAPALRRIRDSVRTPVASCESLFGLRGFKPFFEHASMDVAIIDVPWNGIWTSLKIAAVAEAFEINSAPHNFYGHLSTLMSAHLCAVMPNFRVMEIDIDDVPWKDDIVTWQPTIEDGHLLVPQAPGWGAELNDEVIEAHPPKRVH